MQDNSELDKIITEGKTNSQTAMTVFAIEIRGLKESVNDVKDVLHGDQTKWATKEEVAFLRNIIFAFIGFILIAFMGAVAKGVFL